MTHMHAALVRAKDIAIILIVQLSIFHMIAVPEQVPGHAIPSILYVQPQVIHMIAVLVRAQEHALPTMLPIIIVQR